MKKIIKKGLKFINEDAFNFGISKLYRWQLKHNLIPETEHIKIIVNEEVKKSWLNRLKFDFFTGKKYIKKLQADIVISLQNTIINGLDCPQILYVQQSIPFQTDKKFSFFKKEEQKLWKK